MVAVMEWTTHQVRKPTNTTMTFHEEHNTAIVEGLFTRIKSLVLALYRHDRLETVQDFNGWFETLVEREDELADMALHMTLRALQVASDPVNFRLLRRLKQENTVALRALMAEIDAYRVPTHDRVNILMQAGLAVQELESDDVRITPLGEGIVTWIEAVAQGTAQRLHHWCAEAEGKTT